MSMGRLLALGADPFGNFIIENLHSRVSRSFCAGLLASPCCTIPICLDDFTSVAGGGVVTFAGGYNGDRKGAIGSSPARSPVEKRCVSSLPPPGTRSRFFPVP